MKVQQIQYVGVPRRLPTPASSPPPSDAAAVPGLVLPGGQVLTPDEVLSKLDAKAVADLRSLTGKALAAAHPLSGDAWDSVWLVVGSTKLIERWREAENAGDMALWLDTAATLLKAGNLAAKHIPAAQRALPYLATLGLIASTGQQAFRAVVELDKETAKQLRPVLRTTLPKPSQDGAGPSGGLP